MRVCTCDNQELLNIEDRLAGVKQLYCENFSGCVAPVAGDAAPRDLMPLETSGAVYLRAVNEELQKHHVLAAHPGPPVPTPMLPTATTLAPATESHFALPLLGILAIASVAGAVLMLERTRQDLDSGGVPPGAKASLALLGSDNSEEAAPLRAVTPRAAPKPRSLTPDRVVLPARPPKRAAAAPKVRAPGRALLRQRTKPLAKAPTRPEKKQPAPMLAPEMKPDPVSAPTLAPVLTAMKPDVPATAPVQAGAATGTGAPSLERMLKAATGKTGTVLPPPVELPKRLGPKAITAAQKQMRRRAGHCLRKFGFTHVTATLRVRVRGDRGRVTWAGVRGRLKGTPAGRCIERAARHLRTGRFSQSRQVFTIPIRVH